jgi:hypothetical protein
LTKRSINVVFVILVIGFSLAAIFGYFVGAQVGPTKFVSTTQTIVSFSTIFPKTNSTITKRIVVTSVAHVNAYKSGTCSWEDATISLSSSNYTEYLFPNLDIAQDVRFLNFTVATTTTTLSGTQSVHTDTTITFTQSASSTGQCPPGA